MAKLEIPSIVVHNGNTSVPGSPIMDRKVRMQRSLSKQAEFELDGEETLLHLSCNSIVPVPENTACPPIRNGDVLPEEFSNCTSQSTERLDENHQVPPHTSSRRNSKVKLLVRSHAVREETSPPPEPGSHSTCNNQANNINNLGVGRPNSRHKLRHQGSSQGSMDSSSPSCLSRDSSMEQYTDSTGIDLTQFIAETLNKNYKDRSFLLKVEQELISLAKDLRRNSHKFPQMSSYQRMLIHRVAAYFGMDHNVDQMGNSVIVNRTKNTRLPETRFKDHIRGELFPEEPRKSILKRDSSSFEEGSGFKSPERQFSSESRRSKSFEEREEEYEKARQRIFNRDGNNSSHDSMQDGSRRSSQEELGWPGDIQPWSSSDSDNSHFFRQRMGPGRLLKVESFDAHDMSRGNPTRLSVAKSFSFGGYPGAVLSRGDSCSSTHSAGARLLTKQDSGSSMSSRLSPPSSGYKSQSQRSDATLSATPSPVATPISQTSSQQLPEGQTVMWAVTQLSAVPPGSVLIDPISGQPYVNPDGSVYRYDPSNPPKMGNACASSPTELQLEEQNVIVEECQSDKMASSTSTTCTSPTRHIAPPASTTNSATSPSLPITPPDSQPSATPCSYMTLPPEQTHQPNALVPVSMPTGPISNGSSGALVAPTPPQQYVSVVPSDVVFGGQQVVYAGSQPAYEQRLPGVNEPNRQMSVTELGGYFMGLNLIDQRGGGDCAMGSYQGYWQPSHQSSPISYPAQQPVPMYFVPPAPAPAPPPPPPPAAATATPGQQQQASAAQRFVSPVCHPTVQQAPHAGSYVSSYPVLGPVLPTAPANADCLQHVMYSPSSINTYYHPVGSGSTQPVLASYQPSPQQYRVPTPPCTPTVTQNLCNVAPPFVYVNGGTTGGGGPQTSLVSGLNLFRPAVQMMPGVRNGVPREPKSHYSNRPSSVGEKEKISYNGERPGRYSSVPMFGLHFLPGAPLQQSAGLRMPFGFNSRSQRYFLNSSEVPGRPPRPRKPRSRLPLTGALNRNVGFPQPVNNVTAVVPNMAVASHHHQKTNRINGIP